MIRKEMIVSQDDPGLNEIAWKPEDSGKPLKAKFMVSGEEMIEKKVKSIGNSGRVYVPSDWVGKLVKIIRID